MSIVDLALIAIGSLASQVALARGTGWRRRGALALVTTLGPLAVALAMGRPWPRAMATSIDATPLRRTGLVRVGSESCRSCHPSEHASWGRSFHRTMTQRATLDEGGKRGTLLGPIPSGPVARGGGEVSLARSLEGVVWREAGKTDRRVVLTTGSHHYQAYWAEGARPGELSILPLVYLLADRRYVPRQAVFLTPEDDPPEELAWSASCIQCHAVAGEPHRGEFGERFDTSVAELGIACEACHGPGAAHVDKHRNPITRALAHASKTRDETIVNPKRLPPRERSLVCAQCHSLFVPKDEPRFWETGVATTTPERPFETRDLLTLATMRGSLKGRVDATPENFFWADGTIRVGGREANGLFESPCFEKGQGERTMSCSSCHAMHKGEPDDQLAPERRGDLMCTGCHGGVAARLEAHTHHAPASAGSRCVSCHMPKTTFALLGAIRSHRIESPSVTRAAESGRLPACNLCHLDRDLAWTHDAMRRWGSKENAPDKVQGRASAIAWLLAGDAAKRALAAAQFGDGEARAASGDAWMAPILATALTDPYAAVRYVAARSLQSLVPFSNVRYDFVGAGPARAAAQEVVLQRFQEARGGAKVPLEQRARVLLTPEGTVDEPRLRAFAATRDDRAVRISE